MDLLFIFGLLVFLMVVAGMALTVSEFRKIEERGGGTRDDRFPL